MRYSLEDVADSAIRSWDWVKITATPSLKDFISSVAVRDGTYLDLYIGLSFGIVLVIILIASPGKPIDYGVMADGSPVPAELQLGKAPQPISENEKSSKEGKSYPVGSGDSATTTLRRRKVGGGGHEPGNNDPSDDGAERVKGSGLYSEESFDVDQDIDPDKVASRIRRSKVSRLLGLTEEKVKEAVREAQREMKEGDAYVPPPSYRQQQRTSFKTYADLVVYSVLIGALLFFANRELNGSGTRFLQRFLPKEMATLGFGRTQ